MNEKEIAELRRRFRPDKSAVSHVRGCYVNENKEIVSQFKQSLGVLSQEEGDKLLGTVRKTLSGTLGRNLVDIEFETAQVVNGEEHKLLMALRDSGLEDEEAVQAFFRLAIDALELEGNYLILLCRDAYDVPFRSQDGEKQQDASNEVFSYILCSVCPVKLTKPALSYHAHENSFATFKPDWLVSPPELGFLFPAFDDRSANIYGALYYHKDTGESYPAFTDAVFRRPAPMPADAQKEGFQSVLEDTLAEDCGFDVVESVHEQLRGMIEEHKASKEPEPLALSKGAVKSLLRSCGVADARMEVFEARYDESFGEEAQLSPRNLVDTRQVEVRTPDVTIKVNPERSDLVETRIINGAKYILIRADEGVEVDGVNIRIF